MDTKDFIQKIAPYAVAEQRRSGVLASITIAQAALESAWGKSAPGNNLFGIKGSGTTLDTQEFIDGVWVTIKAGFRSYRDWAGSIIDHSDFLVSNPRYAKAGFFAACRDCDSKAAAVSLQQAGYATDPNYAAKLIGMIWQYDLNQYDKAVNEVDKVLDYPEWAWDNLTKWIGDAYNDKMIDDWEWFRKAQARELTYKELILLKVIIDDRRRVQS